MNSNPSNRSGVSGSSTSRAEFFSASYSTARERFLALCNRNNLAVQSLPLSSVGYYNEPLFLDSTWIGDPQAEFVLLNVGGIHGIEGYLGSAIQLALLSDLPKLPNNTALALVHCVNPWGMSFLRRVNKNNVDLNRNWVVEPNKYSGSSPYYAISDPLLNMEHAPRWNDVFWLEALRILARYGFATMKQAVAGGQYEFPKGLYFGGKERQEEHLVFASWLHQWARPGRKIFITEAHSGLGKFGEPIYYSNVARGSERGRLIAELVGKPLELEDPETSVGFTVAGDPMYFLPREFSDVKIEWVLTEFGTYGPLTMIQGLRAENGYHHSGGRDNNHPTKKKLFELFVPQDPNWRAGVVDEGLDLISNILQAPDLFL